MATANGNNKLQFLTSANLDGLPEQFALGVGLNWQPILGGNVVKEAINIAIKNKASHYVHSEKVGFVGSGVAPKSIATLKGKQLISLARIFALMQQDDGLVSCIVLRLVDKYVWFCSVQNGVVRNDSDTVMLDEDAYEAVKKLQSSFSSLKIWGNADIGLELDGGIQFASLLEQLNKSNVVQLSTIRPVKQSRIEQFRRLPKKLKYFIYALLAALSYSAVLKPLALAAYTMINPPVVVVEDATQMWQGAVNTAYQTMKRTEPHEITKLISKLESLPLELGGWKLKDVLCEAKQAEKKWLCTATFLTSAYGASNQSLNEQKPKDWRMSWLGLKEAKAAFDYDLALVPLDLKTLPSVQELQIKAGTKLQTLGGFLKNNDKALAVFTDVIVPAPKYLSGDVVARPPAIKLLQKSELKIDGPLRTSLALDDVLAIGNWKTLKIEVAPEAKPDKNTSKLNMTLLGDMYAKQP